MCLEDAWMLAGTEVGSPTSAALRVPRQQQEGCKRWVYLGNKLAHFRA